MMQGTKSKLNAVSYFAGDRAKMDSICILLHGLGSNGEDLIQLAKVWARHMPTVLFLSPNAPFPHASGVPSAYQWFDMGTGRQEDMEKGADESAAILEAFMEETLEENAVSSSRLALVGFSQGAAMAIHTGLDRAVAPACIIAYSGAVFSKKNLTHTNKPPVLLVHGTADDVLPYAYMNDTAAYLRSHGIEPTTQTCEGIGHWIDGQGFAAGESFLKKHLNIPQNFE